MEIELKLRVSASEIPRIKAVLKELAGKSPKSRDLLAVYYDTPTGTLRKKGYSFRVRREGRRFVQTLKRTKPNASEALHRDEWDDPVRRQAPDLTHGNCADRLHRKFGRLALKPQFTVHIKRSVYTITPANETCIEAAVDIGHARHAGKSTSITEVELELKSGSVVAIYDTALQLANHIDFQIEPQTKAARGHALVRADRPAAIRMDAPAFDPDQSLADVLKMTARRYFDQYHQNIPAMMAGAEDGVHQMRVAVRRLRSALSAVKDYLSKNDYAWANGQLKAIQQTLGETRDLDVLIARMGTAPALPLRRTRGHRGMVDTLKGRRDAALFSAQRDVTSKSQTFVWLKLMHWFEDLDSEAHKRTPLHKSLRTEVPKILGRLLKRVRKRGRHFPRLSPAEQHRVRIACKKLRYGIDLFASLYRKRDVQRFLSCLKVVQDELGTLNDAHVARRLLMQPTRKETAASAGEALGWIERDIEPVSRKTAEDLRRVFAAKPFW